jgi:hypothetical protein
MLVVTTTAKDVVVTPKCHIHSAVLLGAAELDCGEIMLGTCYCPDGDQQCAKTWFMEITYYRSEAASVRMSIEDA